MHCLEFPEQCYITNHTKHPNLQVFSFKYDIKVVFQGGSQPHCLSRMLPEMVDKGLLCFSELGSQRWD